MKVSIIGPGALGCLFAARMQRAGIKTTLVDHSPERAKRLEKSGVTVEADEETYTEKIKVATSTPLKQDLVIVLCKAHQSESLKLPAQTPILSLQNGLGNVEQICSIVGSANTLAGITSQASTLLSEGRVRHVAEGETRIGAWTSCPVDVAQAALGESGFEVNISESPGQMIWEKVAISAGINPLTALLDVPNGRLVEMREARKLIRDLVVEASKVASTEGYRFPYSLVEKTEEVCRDTANNISSMLQDVRAGRQTEIEAISGEILRRAAEASLPVPRTRAIYQLVKSLEEK